AGRQDRPGQHGREAGPRHRGGAGPGERRVDPRRGRARRRRAQPGLRRARQRRVPGPARPRARPPRPGGGPRPGLTGPRHGRVQAELTPGTRPARPRPPRRAGRVRPAAVGNAAKITLRKALPGPAADDNWGMTRAVYVAAREAGSNKGVVALGMVEALSRKVGKVGVFRPVVRAGRPDGLITTVLARFGIDLPYE